MAQTPPSNIIESGPVSDECTVVIFDDLDNDSKEIEFTDDGWVKLRAPNTKIDEQDIRQGAEIWLRKNFVRQIIDKVERG